jgi:putative SOS response-associated peptidase YedK
MVRKFSFARTCGVGAISNFPRYNGAPRQLYPIIVREELEPPADRHVRIGALGLIPMGERGPLGGRQPINARSETVATDSMFRYAYRSQRALLPIDVFFEWVFFEWKDIFRTGKHKQSYAIAMKDGSPFAPAALGSYGATRRPARTSGRSLCSPARRTP